VVQQARGLSWSSASSSQRHLGLTCLGLSERVKLLPVCLLVCRSGSQQQAAHSPGRGYPPRSPHPAASAPPTSRATLISPATLATALPAPAGSRRTGAGGDASPSTASPAAQAAMALWRSGCAADEAGCGNGSARQATEGLPNERDSTASEFAAAAAAAQPMPSAQAMAWAVRNIWFGSDKDMTRLAYQVCDRCH
jgi:hypothetical protein